MKDLNMNIKASKWVGVGVVGGTMGWVVVEFMGGWWWVHGQVGG